jgi:hypothetical protein
MKKSDALWNTLLFGSLMGYFLLMKALGLHQLLGLRYLNLFIHIGIVYLAMRSYRAHIHEEGFSFLETAMVGVRASLPAIVLFALFQFTYLRFIDPAFMTHIKDTAPMGHFLTPAIVTLGLFAEGILATFFNSYVCMRFIAAKEKAKFPAL